MRNQSYILLSLLTLFALNTFGQGKKSDTIYVRTFDAPTFSSMSKYYVIDGKREMRITIKKDSTEKKDTVYYDDICEETMRIYKEDRKIDSIRALPIEKIDADMAFKYFRIGDSIDIVTKKLGRKKIHVSPTGFKVPFYNKFSRKNELIELSFSEGKLWRISRPSTNTLPTNDVWMAFQLIPLKESLKDLELAVKKLRQKQQKKKK
ncbi:MAG: hypothetical protein Q4E48_13250 [Prevotella sp.]|nr:hypothetical protein [Prevotella sp.]